MFAILIFSVFCRILHVRFACARCLEILFEAIVVVIITIFATLNAITCAAIEELASMCCAHLITCPKGWQTQNYLHFFSIRLISEIMLKATPSHRFRSVNVFIDIQICTFGHTPWHIINYKTRTWIWRPHSVCMYVYLTEMPWWFVIIYAKRCMPRATPQR